MSEERLLTAVDRVKHARERARKEAERLGALIRYRSMVEGGDLPITLRDLLEDVERNPTPLPDFRKAIVEAIAGLQDGIAIEINRAAYAIETGKDLIVVDMGKDLIVVDMGGPMDEED